MTHIGPETGQQIETEYLSRFAHNSEVEGLNKQGNLLFTMTQHYLYIWRLSPRRLQHLSDISSGQGSILESVREREEEAFPESKEIEELLQKRDIYIFGNKKYVRIFGNLEFSVYKQDDFIAHTRAPEGYIAVEKKFDLYLYTRGKRGLGRLPEKHGICTSLRWEKGALYGAFESGHLLRINIEEKKLSTSLFYYSSPSPILSFLIFPLVISYFGKRLLLINPHQRALERDIQITHLERTKKIGSGEVEQVLFIALSRHRMLWLSEDLQILAEREERAELVFPAGESLFLCRETGILLEMRTGSSTGPLPP